MNNQVATATATTMDDENKLKQLLKQYNLERFYTKLEEEGYDCVADVRDIGDAELKEYGFKAGHIKKFHRAIAENNESGKIKKSEVAGSKYLDKVLTDSLSPDVEPTTHTNLSPDAEPTTHTNLSPDAAPTPPKKSEIASSKHFDEVQTGQVELTMHADLSPDAIPAGLSRLGTIDKGSYVNDSHWMSLFFVLIGVMLFIIFAATDLYDIMIIYPGPLTFVGLIMSCFGRKITYSFDHKSCRYKIERTKGMYQCLRATYTGHYNAINRCECRSTGVKINKKPTYDLYLVINDKFITIRTEANFWHTAQRRVEEWNNYIKNTLHNPPPM